MGSQASKRKRKQIRKFRAKELGLRCADCGVKIPTGSKHHFHCQKCWHVKEERKKNRYGGGSS